MKLKRYFWNILVSIDQLLNTILAGDPDMTISGRAGRAVNEGRCRLCKAFCKFVDWFDKDHCKKTAAKEADEGLDPAP